MELWTHHAEDGFPMPSCRTFVMISVSSFCRARARSFGDCCMWRFTFRTDDLRQTYVWRVPWNALMNAFFSRDATTAITLSKWMVGRVLQAIGRVDNFLQIRMRPRLVLRLCWFLRCKLPCLVSVWIKHMRLIMSGIVIILWSGMQRNSSWDISK